MGIQLSPEGSAKEPEPTSIQGAIDAVNKAKDQFLGSDEGKQNAIRILDAVAGYMDRVASDAQISSKLGYLGLALTGVQMIVLAARGTPKGLAGRVRSGYPMDADFWDSQVGQMVYAKEALQILAGERFQEQTKHFHGGLYASDEEEVNHDLATSLKKHVAEASTMTGEKGIPELMIAAVLKEEMLNTDVTGIRSPSSARSKEIGEVGEALDRAEQGEDVKPSDINHSIGVGQVKLATGAMLAGMIPWRESHDANRREVRRQTESDFRDLDVASKKRLFRALSTERGSTITAAALLKRLKNRSNRYPDLTRSAFGANQRAVEIIATEYNLGASDTEEAAARPSDYGQRIWTRMQTSVLKRNFSNG